MPLITFQNKKINYKVSGRGNSTVVLLHGFLEDLSMWDELTEELFPDYKVISIDLPGHGESDNLADVHTMEMMAEVVSDVLKEEKSQSIKIVGHSMGGYVALALAQESENIVEKLILLNSTAIDDGSQKKEDRLRAIKVLEAGKKQFINEAIPKLFAEQKREKLHSEIEETKTIAQKTSPNGISAALLGMRERKNSVEWIKSSGTQVVYISGDKDGIIRISSCEEQAKETQSKLYKLNSCGHMALLEAKKDCFEAIINELK